MQNSFLKCSLISFVCASIAAQSVAGVIAENERRWPTTRIPFVIDPALPSPTHTKIKEAIAKWNSQSPVKLEPIGANDVFGVHFIPGSLPDYCLAEVGHQKGRSNEVEIPDDCSVAHIMHEIGHAVGLLHEHSHCHRDQFIRVQMPALDAVLKKGMAKYSCLPLENRYGARMTTGGYDFASIMHYSSSLGQFEPLFEVLPAGRSILTIDEQRIGELDELSQGDVQAIKELYELP